MPIRRLEESCIAKLRSGICAPTFTQCVEELVANAIDASANTIKVCLDMAGFRIEIRDNGVGISHSDLLLVGDRYATSKCHNVSDLNNLQVFILFQFFLYIYISFAVSFKKINMHTSLTECRYMRAARITASVRDVNGFILLFYLHA